MYKALNYWVYGGFDGKRTPFEFIDFAAKCGLDGVELTVGDALSIDITEAECRKIAEYAASKNIGLKTIASGNYWGVSFTSPDPEVRRQANVFSNKYLRLASWLGAESVLIIPGATRVAWEESLPVVSYKDAWERSQEEIAKIVPLAEALGVNIALENVWGRFLFSPMEWKYYIDDFHSDRVGIYFDAGNCAVLVNPQDFIDILGKRIKAVHIKNFKGTDCGGGLHGFGDSLVDGDINVKAFLEGLQSSGYIGPVTAEMIPFSRLPDLVLPDEELAAATARALLSI